MPSGFRFNNVDFDDLFEAGTHPVAMYRRADGQPLQYLARGTAPKRGDVLYRDAAGVDLSNYWLPKGAAPPVMDFNGKQYGANAAAPTNAQGNTSATLILSIMSDGNWMIQRSISGSFAGGNGTVVVESGTWLPAGQTVSQYEVAFTVSAPGNLTVGNSAPAFASLTTTRTCSVGASVPSASSQNVNGTATIVVTLRRNGSVTSDSTLYFTVGAVGWF